MSYYLKRLFCSDRFLYSNCDYFFLRWYREVGWESVDWIHLTQDMDQWRALVNMVMKLRVT
jgi:hypothetical protein